MEIKKDTVIIVTGSARGLGKSLIEKYAPAGAKIYGTYITSDEKAKSIEQKYPNVKMLKVDNTKTDEISDFINEVAQKEGKIDILVNNAGSIQHRKKIIDLSTDNFKNLLDVHVVGTFVYCKSVLPHMIKEDSGVIVNIASRFGLFEWAKKELGALNVAKAGVNMLTKVLFQELQNTNIRVNSVLPAPTLTNFLETLFSQEELDSMKEKGILGEKEEFVEQVNDAIIDEELNGKFLISKRLK